jgi:hypothetical protein
VTELASLVATRNEREMLGRPAVRAYLAALNAWLEAGAENAPASITGLKQAALAELLNGAESVEDIAA